MNVLKKNKLSLYVSIGLIVLVFAFFAFAALVSSLGYSQSTAAQRNSRLKEVIADQASDDFYVIIDAGHGGEDPGAVTDYAVEKEINLKLSQMLRCFFAVSGYNTVMTRTEDKLLYDAGQSDRKKLYDLHNRALFSGKYPNSVFISIHMNKFPIEKYHGLQTFYSVNNERSQTLAQSVQEYTKLLTPDNKRKIKSLTDIYLLKTITTPCILIECGFISNYTEAMNLKDDEYCNKLAFCIFCGIMDFLENSDTPT